jgi:integrase|tara:strand:+ start:12368 stop:13606 length:1239 start_codon:yes stop_codon:yes gene_type:complete
VYFILDPDLYRDITFKSYIAVTLEIGVATNQIIFTQARIKNLAVPESGYMEYTDIEQSKLICRISSSGNRSYIVRKRVQGRLRNITIGKCSDWNVKDARVQAQHLLLALARNEDPILNKRKKEKLRTTLADLLVLYLDNRSLQPKTIEDYQYKTEKYLSDWLSKPVSAISSHDVQTKFKELSEIGKTTANGTMRIFRLLMLYAVALELIEESPTKVLKNGRLWHKNNRSKRVIPSNKLKNWLDAVEQLTNQKAKTYLLMLLRMGVRSSSALSLKWCNVDLDGKTAKFDTKTGTDVMLPIPDRLIPTLEELHKETGTNIWVFPNLDGDNPMWVPKKQINRIINHINLKFSSHDLRRTFATLAEACGLPTTLIKRMLDHVTDSDVTGGYIITEQDTLRKAFNQVSQLIDETVKA